MMRSIKSADPATAGIRRVRASPCFSGYLLKCLLLCHLHLFRGEFYVRRPNPPSSAQPSGQPKKPPRAPHGALWSALARYGTTFRDRISKMVISGASKKAPAVLSLERELNFALLGSCESTKKALKQEPHPAGLNRGPLPTAICVVLGGRLPGTLAMKGIPTEACGWPDSCPEAVG